MLHGSPRGTLPVIVTQAIALIVASGSDLRRPAAKQGQSKSIELLANHDLPHAREWQLSRVRGGSADQKAAAARQATATERPESRPKWASWGCPTNRSIEWPRPAGWIAGLNDNC